MTPRKLLLIVGVLALVLAFWFLLPRSEVGAVIPHRTPLASPQPSTITQIRPTEVTYPRPTPLPPEALKTISLAADLNAPGGSITADLQMLNNVMTDWRLDYPQTGNPVGENAMITAALTGDNPLRLSYIARTHRAINSDGELCDRWGTPFRFHALSGRRMELRSAGPDKKFGTDDDALLTPP